MIPAECIGWHKLLDELLIAKLKLVLFIKLDAVRCFICTVLVISCVLNVGIVENVHSFRQIVHASHKIEAAIVPPKCNVHITHFIF